MEVYWDGRDSKSTEKSILFLGDDTQSQIYHAYLPKCYLISKGEIAYWFEVKKASANRKSETEVCSQCHIQVQIKPPWVLGQAAFPDPPLRGSRIRSRHHHWLADKTGVTGKMLSAWAPSPTQALPGISQHLFSPSKAGETSKSVSTLSNLNAVRHFRDTRMGPLPGCLASLGGWAAAQTQILVRTCLPVGWAVLHVCALEWDTTMISPQRD